VSKRKENKENENFGKIWRREFERKWIDSKNDDWLNFR